MANFQLDSKIGRAQFFQKTFLLANTSMDVVLGYTDQVDANY